MATVTRTARSSAPRDIVWEVLSRSADWADWSDVSASVREADGEGHPDGVGSIRQAWAAGLVKLREKVVTFEPETGTYEYVLLSGLPLKDYKSTVTLSDDGKGTKISWTSSAKPGLPLPLPGADQVNGVAMGLVIGRLVKALAAEADRRA